MKPETFYSHGKLLLTGEYVVLDGALSLAFPTKFGQSMEISPLKEPKLIWKSFDDTNNIWFETVFTLQEIAKSSVTLDNDKANRLFQMLQATQQLNPGFLKTGCQVKTQLTFPQDWGLGSSSTLINNMANWAQVDPYKLLGLTFGGSGYDIACAQHNTAITYQIENNIRHIKEANFNPSFKDTLYFVYLNKKQNSRDGIAQYKANTSNKTRVIKEVSEITTKLISCSNLTNFNKLLNRHEQLISNTILQAPVKEKLFPDFKGAVKSLGAWGGDFVLVTSEENPRDYFKAKGFDTILPFAEMVK